MFSLLFAEPRIGRPKVFLDFSLPLVRRPIGGSALPEDILQVDLPTAFYQ